MNPEAMNRRGFVGGAMSAVGTVGALGSGLVPTAGLGASPLVDTASPAKLKGRIQQSLCSWNFAPLTPEELAREAGFSRQRPVHN